MKTILMVLGAIFLVVILGFVALLIWAGASGSKIQAEFFTAVESGDPGKVTALFAPNLRQDVEEPVLASWMQAVKLNLGAFKGLSKTDFNTSTKIENGVKVTESKGTVNFEKGEATSELVFHDGKLAGFYVKSDKLTGDWFKGPVPDSQLYRQRGQKLITLIVEDKPEEAFKLMHEELQKAMPLEKLKTISAGIPKAAGKLKSLAYKSEKFDPGESSLKIYYKIECEKSDTIGEVEFKRDGMKLHIFGFDLTGGAE